MSDQSKDSGPFQYAAGDLSVDALRKRALEGQMDATALGAMTEALDLYSFMKALPDAFVASQKREAKRLEEFTPEKSPRIEALKVSIDEAQKLQMTARWGQSRIDRTVAAIMEPNDVFHGFVSNTVLQPQKGYTVTLVGTDGKARLSAATGSDGYFTMTLKAREKASPFSGKDAVPTALLAEMLQLFGMRRPGTDAPIKTDKETQIATVEILDPSGRRIQQDPIPVDVNGGTVYREYVVETKETQSATKRYVGNSSTRELHDTEKLTNRCNFDAIKANHKVYFDTTAAAEKAGYDYCAYCFDKTKSKR
jgi:hypothetical protein